MECAICDVKNCSQGEDCTTIGTAIIQTYSEDSTSVKMAKVSAELEGNHYMQMTRLEELIAFSRHMDFRRLGLAFCIGLSEEANMLHRILAKHFEVCSVCCKVCGIEK